MSNRAIDVLQILKNERIKEKRRIKKEKRKEI
jgi:hypothetical protein